MIRTRMIAAALLFNSRDELLMMKRSPLRTLSPGLWGAVGGHMEPVELNDPYATVVREIREESGIAAEELAGLRLQYVLIRLNAEEIRQQFIYVGRTDAEPSVLTDEGELIWIRRDAVLDRPLPFIFRMLLDHYLTHGDTDHAWMAVAGRDGGDPVVRFTPLLDPLPPGAS